MNTGYLFVHFTGEQPGGEQIYFAVSEDGLHWKDLNLSLIHILCARSMPVPKREGKVRLRILLDKYSVEIFANGGESVMTSLITTPQEADGICFSSGGGAQADIRMYPIRNEKQ